MSEGEQGMPGPEQQRPVSGPEQTPEKTPQAIFEENLRGLIEPQVTKNEKGEEVTRPPAVEDEHIVRLAKQALVFAGRTPEGLRRLIEKGNDLCIEGEIPENNWDEWSAVAVVLDERLAALLQERQKNLGDAGRKERLIPRRDLPSGIGAIFVGGKMDQYIRNDEIDPQENMICRPWEAQGKIESFVDNSGRTVESTSRNGREGWLFENYYAATMERGAEQSWYGIVKFWCDDFEASMDWLEGRKEDYPQLSSKEQEEFLRKIKAFGAVFASARAAEASKGDYSAYAMLIAPPKLGESKPDLDKQDDWKDLLLANDKSKINIVLGDRLVRHFFEKAVKSMGISVHLSEPTEPGVPGWVGWEKWDGKINSASFEDTTVTGSEGKAKMKEGELPYYLSEGGKRGGFDGFIREVLLSENATNEVTAEFGKYGRHELQAAAKLACDTILVNGMYSLWVYNHDKDGDYNFAPHPNWGGDPFRFMLEPSFLPRRVKKVYKESPDVMDSLDSAFRPEKDLSKKKEEQKKKQEKEINFEFLTASGTTHLKKAYRLNAAIFEVLGDSQASGLASFSEQAIDSLYNAAKLIDYVYGDTKQWGKDVAGLIMGKILKTKAYALSSEWHKAGFRDAFKILMGSDDVVEALKKAIELVWGADRDGSGGLIAKIAGGQLYFKVKSNRLGAQKEFDEALRVLAGFGIPKEQGNVADKAKTAKFFYDLLAEIGRQKH